MIKSFPFHLIWIIALIAGFFPVSGWQLGCLGICVTALVTWFCISAYTFSFDQKSIPKHFLFALITAFLLWAALSLTWSQTPFVSLLGLTVFASLPLTFLAGTLSPKALPTDQVQKILAVIFCVLGMWACIQFFFLANTMGGRASHPLANPNALAVVFNIGFFLSLTRILKQDLKPPLLHWVTVALCLAGMMMTASRGGLLALCLVLCIFLMAGYPALKARWKSVLGALVLVILSFGLTFFAQDTGDSLAQRVISNAGAEQLDITGNRMNIWTAAFGVTKDHLWLGTGIGSFFLYYNEYRTPTDMMGASHAHADPLQFWAELGLPGLVLFYAVLLSVLFRTLSALKKTNNDPGARLSVLGPFAALLVVAVQAHYSFPLYNLSILLLTGATLVFWWRATDAVLQTKQMIPFADVKPDIKAAVLIIPVLGLWFVYSLTLTSEVFVNKARSALFDGNLEAFATHIQTANRLGFDANARAWILAVNVPLTLMEQKKVVIDPAKRQALFEEANFYLDQVERFNPRISSVYFYRARAIELSGQEDQNGEIEALYKRTLKIDPVHLGARMALADFYETQGRNEEAYTTLKNGLGYFFRATITPKYLGRLAQMAMVRGDTQTQKKAMDALKLYYTTADGTKSKERAGFWGTFIGQEKMPALAVYE